MYQWISSDCAQDFNDPIKMSLQRRFDYIRFGLCLFRLVWFWNEVKCVDMISIYANFVFLFVNIHRIRCVIDPQRIDSSSFYCIYYTQICILCVCAWYCQDLWCSVSNLYYDWTLISLIRAICDLEIIPLDFCLRYLLMFIYTAMN